MAAKTNKGLKYNPVQSLSILSTEAIPEHRCVSYAGALSTVDVACLGVTEVGWDSGDLISVVTLGTVIIETSEAVAVGDNLSAEATGKVSVTDGAEVVVGRALTAVSGAGFVVMKIVP
jgi:hypothetical protein